GSRSPVEAQITDLVGKVAPEPPPAPQRPAPAQPVPKAAVPPPAPPAPAARVVQEVIEELEPAELELPPEPIPAMEPTAAPMASDPALDGEFDVNRLSAEEQELHRRANRVAKVSMQDIKM